MQAVCSSLIATPAAAVCAAKTQKAPVFSALARAAPKAAAVAPRAVGNGVESRQMLVWEPVDNKYFETLSYLPPLTNDQIAKQIDYIVSNGWIPALEFADAESAYVGSANTIRFGAVAAGYYDNRYWSMYKLPMFGCTDASQVLAEIKNATEAFPDAYIRVAAFDNVRQVQVVAFLVHRPPSAKDYREISQRSR